MTDPHPTVYTIGHGPRSFGHVAAALIEHGIGVIVDVRSSPFSRYAPDFTRDRLIRLSAEANLGYRWLGDRLGGRPDDPELRRGDSPDWTAIEQSAAFRAGITELDGLARAGRVALLCAEQDPTQCHRAFLIAPAMERLGFAVTHILPNGSAVPHHDTLFPER